MQPPPTLPAVTSTVVDVAWVEVGMLDVDARGRIVVPNDLPAAPGVYRIAIDGERIYVGEAADLRRRFNGYRSPGPTQTTNQRIAALVADVEYAHLTIATEADANAVSLDLHETAARRLVENLTVLDLDGHGWDVVNRGAVTR